VEKWERRLEAERDSERHQKKAKKKKQSGPHIPLPICAKASGCLYLISSLGEAAEKRKEKKDSPKLITKEGYDNGGEGRERDTPNGE